MARREWGSGSFFRLNNGRWRVSVSLGSDAFGKRQRKEWQVRSESAAKAKLKDAQRRLTGGLPVEESRVTLGVYAQEWLGGIKGNVRPSTLSFYRTIAEVHLEEIEHLPLVRISPADIRRILVARLEAGYAPRTVRAIVDICRMILKQALVDGIVTRNVAELVQRPKLEQAEPKHFTADEARRFLAAVEYVDNDGENIGTLYAVALGTGLRRGELVALTWNDVEDDAVIVRSGKTDAAARRVPLPAFAAAALATMPKRPGPIWRVHEDTVTDKMKVICEKAGLPYVGVHGLRHTFASLALDAGVDPFTLQRLLGHAKPHMTSFYARSGEATRREAVERMARLVS